MTPDDEIREAARLARFLATGEIEPRYDVRKECWAGSLAGPATSFTPGKEATWPTHIPVSTIDS